MHIAVCDDNIADRKHLERLLGRESDKRAGTPNLLYVDSYGDSAALLRNNPTMYDLFFLDLVETPTLCQETVTKLLDCGVKVPLALCSSKINYQLLSDLPENTLFIEKPYHVDSLEEILQKAQDYKNSQVPTLEMRSTEGTRYVTRDSILYAYSQEENILVTQKNGETFEIHGQPFEFYENFRPYSEFCAMQQKVVINMNYILRKSFFSITMIDHTEHRLSLANALYFRQRYKKFLANKE